MAEREFRPGDLVPDSGVYIVVHGEHRGNHEAVLVAGNKFPACARCGAGVRFRLLRDAASIEKDPDFRQQQPPADRHRSPARSERKV